MVRLLYLVKAALIGFVAYVTLPTIFAHDSTAFQRAFAALVLVFFAYLIARSLAVWRTIAPDIFGKR
ncbi:MAG: hypothetical protein NVSMB19_20300 [Vulcanimicrobiaceae bacterium]